ncbi:MAG: hypothetical protein AAF614_33155 [Chloroflexota bacterium]
MTISDVQLRTRLRQADRVANSGKRVAAQQLYREILDQAPNAKEAWLGLAQVVDEADKQAAYEKVLSLDPENKEAKEGLEWLRTGIRPTPVVQEAKTVGQEMEPVGQEMEPVGQEVKRVETAVSTPPPPPPQKTPPPPARREAR